MSNEENLHSQIINVLRQYRKNLHLPLFFPPPFKVNHLISLGLDTITKNSMDKNQTARISHDQASRVQPMRTDVRNPVNTESNKTSSSQQPSTLGLMSELRSASHKKTCYSPTSQLLPD